MVRPKGGSIDKLISVFQTPNNSTAIFKKNSICAVPMAPSSIGETHKVNSVQMLSSDVLISGSADKTIKFWNIQTGACLQTLTGVYSF